MNLKMKKVAEETIQAFENKQYKTPSGQKIRLNDKFVSKSVLYKPDSKISIPDFSCSCPKISVTNETTLQCAARYARYSKEDPCLLNFASARHPGGGFLGGAMAQEESIARSSGLYFSLIEHQEYYNENKNSDCYYLDYAIYSPSVQVIRDDDGNWLEIPYNINVVTSPAPNRGAMGDELDEDKLNKILKNRIE